MRPKHAHWYKRHTKSKRVTYEDLGGFRGLDEEQQFLVLEELHRKSNAAEPIAALAFIIAFCTLFLGPIFSDHLEAELEAGTARADIAVISIGALFFAFFFGHAINAMLACKHRAHLYETFGLEMAPSVLISSPRKKIHLMNRSRR